MATQAVWVQREHEDTLVKIALRVLKTLPFVIVGARRRVLEVQPRNPGPDETNPLHSDAAPLWRCFAAAPPRSSILIYLPSLVREPQRLGVGGRVEHGPRVHAHDVQVQEVVVRQETVSAKAHEKPVIFFFVSAAPQPAAAATPYPRARSVTKPAAVAEAEADFMSAQGICGWSSQCVQWRHEGRSSCERSSFFTSAKLISCSQVSVRGRASS